MFEFMLENNIKELLRSNWTYQTVNELSHDYNGNDSDIDEGHRNIDEDDGKIDEDDNGIDEDDGDIHEDVDNWWRLQCAPRFSSIHSVHQINRVLSVSYHKEGGTDSVYWTKDTTSLSKSL